MGIQIHELTALNRAPQTGDVLAVDTGTTTNKVDYSALRGAVLTDAVRTDDDQNLTDAQKAQAIENIGAATQADVTAIEDEIGNTTLPTTAQTITGAIAEVANGAVRYDIAQSLTSSEQIRARNNIGAANGAEQMILVQNYGKCLRFNEQTLTESQKTQARTNIGAASETDTDALETLVGNTTLPTTAQTVTGAIAEHETDISNINSAIGTVPSGSNLQGEVDDLKSAINNVTPNMTTFATGGGLDPNGNLVYKTDIADQYWVNNLTGEYAETPYSYCSSGYVEIEPEENYTWLSGTKPYSYGFYDENKTVISGAYGRTIGVHYVTAPLTAKYLIYCWNKRKANLENPMMIKGTTEPTEYSEPHNIPTRLVDSDYATQEYVDERIPPLKPTLELPSQYELVVGDTFQLFWKGVINAVDYTNVFPECSCDIGSNYTRFFMHTPVTADIGTHTLTVKLYDNGQNLLDEQTVDLVVKAKATSPASKKVLLYITDSLGESGYVPDEFNRRLVGTGGTPAGDGLSNITFIGTNTSVSHSIKYIGNGGWSWAQYNASMISNKYMWITVASHDKTSADQHSIYSDGTATWKIETIEATKLKIIRETGTSALPSTGTLTWVSGGENHSNIVYTASEQAAGNPLWDSETEKISFANFVESQGENTLDYLYVLLGWNSTDISEGFLKSYMRTFLTNCLTDYPNCKIVILGVEIPSRDGLARNYDASYAVLSSYRQSMNFAFNLNKWYAEVAAEDDYKDNVSFVNVAGQFDTEYNMPSMSVAVNTRNNTTVVMQRNGVHPAECGYYQIADACYRDFVHKLQS